MKISSILQSNRLGPAIPPTFTISHHLPPLATTCHHLRPFATICHNFHKTCCPPVRTWAHKICIRLCRFKCTQQRKIASLPLLCEHARAISLEHAHRNARAARARTHSKFPTPAASHKPAMNDPYDLPRWLVKPHSDTLGRRILPLKKCFRRLFFLRFSPFFSPPVERFFS